MSKILDDIGQTIGHTPLVRLGRIGRGLPGEILGKFEGRNPGGSVKDRIGLAMIEDAEKKGQLKPGAVLVEATSGNTGIALSMIAASRGYRMILTMPETMSSERVSLLRAYGAEVVLTPGTLMREAVERAQKILRETPGSVMLQQFENPANPAAHRATTGPEIWDDTEGTVDCIVAGVGTGGTITGVGEYLKSQKPSVWTVAVEPKNSAILSGGRPGPHRIQGIGAGFIPKILNRAIIDEIVAVSEDDAFEHARMLASEEGILVGMSAGAAITAAIRVASRPTMEGKIIVVILCDTGEHYLTTPLFQDSGPTKR